MIPIAGITSALLAAASSSSSTGGAPPSIALWNSGVCPYAQRPWIALLEKSVPFRHRLIDLSDKPPDFVAKYGRAAGLSNGQAGVAKVPLLEHGDELVIESDVVAEYVIRNVACARGDTPDDRMYPAGDADTCQRVDSFLQSWHPVVDRYYGVLTITSSEGEEGVGYAENKLVASLFGLEEELLKSDSRELGEGGDNFVLGSTFSLAECIAAPWVQRLFVTFPYFRGIDFQRDVLYKNGLDRTSSWMRAVRDRPSVLESKCPEDEMLAAARRYYVSYLSPGAPGVL